MQEKSLLDYWLILYQRRFVIYLVIFTSVAASIIITLAATPVYEARAALYLPVKPSQVSYLAGEGATGSLIRGTNAPLADEDGYKPYIGILKSRRLAEMVNKQFPKKSIPKLLRSDVDFETTDDMIVRVYSRDNDPELAAKVADAYVEGLNRILAEGSLAQVAREPDYIKSAVASNQADLRKAEEVLKRFEEKHHLGSLDTELVELTKQKTDLQSKWEANSVSLAANQSKQKALLDELRREGQDLEASEVAVTSSVIEQLRTQLATLLTKLAELETELGKNNIQIIAQYRAKADLEQQLRDEIRRWLTSRIKPENSKLEALRQQLIDVVVEGQQLEASGIAYLQSLARVSERMRRYPEIKAQWTDLNGEVARLRDADKQLTVGLSESRLQSGRNMLLVEQLDRAEPPKSPAFPIWWLNAFVALLGGALAGVGYAFFLNYVESTRQVRTTKLVRAILGHDDDPPSGLTLAN